MRHRDLRDRTDRLRVGQGLSPPQCAAHSRKADRRCKLSRSRSRHHERDHNPRAPANAALSRRGAIASKLTGIHRRVEDKGTWFARHKSATLQASAPPTIRWADAHSHDKRDGLRCRPLDFATTSSVHRRSDTGQGLHIPLVLQLIARLKGSGRARVYPRVSSNAGATHPHRSTRNRRRPWAAAPPAVTNNRLTLAFTILHGSTNQARAPTRKMPSDAYWDRPLHRTTGRGAPPPPCCTYRSFPSTPIDTSNAAPTAALTRRLAVSLASPLRRDLF